VPPAGEAATGSATASAARVSAPDRGRPRLTPRGIGFLAAGAGTYGLGLALGYLELFVLAAGAVLPVLIGLGWVLRRPALLMTREIEPERVPRGEPAFGALTIRNPTRFSSAPATAVEPCGPVRVPVAVPRLVVGGSTTARYRLPTDRRRVYDVGPVEITRSDPLGLWQTVQRSGDTRRVWVHPVARPLLGLPAGRTRSLDGASSDRVPHGSITFHALREYVVGDDLRLVHWRSFARTGTLMVRENIDTSLPQITLLVDTRSAVHAEAGFEEAMDVAASVVMAAGRAGYALRLITSGGRSVAGRGVTVDARPMLDLLAELAPSPEPDLRGLVGRLSTERRSDTLIAVSGAATRDDLAVIGAVARRYDDALVGLLAPDDPQAPVWLGIPVLRGETADELVRRWNQRVVAR
jgi:uncharacterized protein (DUF58 family)